MKSENEWYASKEHFNTEMSYEEYKEKLKKKIKANKSIKLFKK